MITLLRKNKAFFLPYIFVFLVFVPVLILIPKGTIHLYLNSFHSTTFDQFFRIITYLGDGWMPVILAVLYLFLSIRKSLLILSSGLIAGILAQFFKRVIFPEIVRPVKFFEAAQELHLVEGVKMHSAYSFPSGHAATIFAICLCLAVYSKNSVLKFLLFLIACIVAYSRVYLSQHFVNDIFAGSLIGCLVVLPMFQLFFRIDKDWMDKSLMDLFSK